MSRQLGHRAVVALAHPLSQARCSGAEGKVPYARLDIGFGEGPRTAEVEQRPKAERCVRALSAVAAPPSQGGRGPLHRMMNQRL